MGFQEFNQVSQVPNLSQAVITLSSCLGFIPKYHQVQSRNSQSAEYTT